MIFHPFWKHFFSLFYFSKVSVGSQLKIESQQHQARKEVLFYRWLGANN